MGEHCKWIILGIVICAVSVLLDKRNSEIVQIDTLLCNSVNLVEQNV